MSIEVTVVVENTAVQEALVAEHGLAVHLACGRHSFLFDTSWTPEALSANALVLSLDLSAVKGAVISHGHLDHTGGLSAPTGCCHRGLRNTLRTARFLARGEPIRMVLGGFHLGRAKAEHLAAAALEEVNPDVTHPCHCAGGQASEYLAGRFPGKVKPLHGGMRLCL